jgi:hypothetical protein
MSDLELGCWFDMGDAVCLLPDEHDGPHQPTPDSEIMVSLVSKRLRPDVTPVTQPPIGLRGVVLSVTLSIPWWIGAYQIIRWILR